MWQGVNVLGLVSQENMVVVVVCTHLPTFCAPPCMPGLPHLITHTCTWTQHIQTHKFDCQDHACIHLNTVHWNTQLWLPDNTAAASATAASAAAASAAAASAAAASAAATSADGKGYKSTERDGLQSSIPAAFDADDRHAGLVRKEPVVGHASLTSSNALTEHCHSVKLQSEWGFKNKKNYAGSEKQLPFHWRLACIDRSIPHLKNTWQPKNLGNCLGANCAASVAVWRCRCFPLWNKSNSHFQARAYKCKTCDIYLHKKGGQEYYHQHFVGNFLCNCLCYNSFAV